MLFALLFRAKVGLLIGQPQITLWALLFRARVLETT
jgi:hypothetical protein